MNNIFTNDPRNLIRLGNNEDRCYICYNNAIDDAKERNLDPTSKWNLLEELKGAFEYKPMLKIRINGSDLCICKDHLEELNTNLAKASKLMEVAEEKEEVAKKDLKKDPKEEAKKETKKTTKKEETKDEQKK